MASSPVPKDSPVMIAWEAYKSEADYANTRRWALHEEHVDGSLWAAFNAGHFAAHSVIAGKVAELTQALEPFSAVAAKLNPDLPDDTPITLTLDGGVLYVFALKRFRKARAALAPYPERRHE